MTIKPGVRLRSAVSSCEVVVVRAPATAAPLLCGGVEMAAASNPVPAEPPAGAVPILLGKRYGIDEEGLEVLCVSAGHGPLTYNGGELLQKAAKALPASD